MAHWIVHLRVAQGLYTRAGLRSRESFLLGNIAPDSGDPRPDGKGYEPDGSVTHFSTLGAHGEKLYHEERFVARYMTPDRRDGYDTRSYAFYLGYLTHLLTDKLWRGEISAAARERLSALRQADHTAYVRKVNADWAQLDFAWLHAHPDFEAFRLYMGCKDLTNRYVDFYDENAFLRLRERQIPYYQKALAEFSPRETYLSEAELSDFIDRACGQIWNACELYFSELIIKEELEQ